MWRRVSCEQPLDTSQSILRLRGSLNQMFGDFTVWRETKLQPKGNPVHIPEPGSGTVFDLVNRGNTNRLRDAHRNSGKSFLFCISHRVPGILLKREWVLVIGEEWSTFCFIHERSVGPWKSQWGYGAFASARTHIRSRSPRLTASGR